LHLANYQLIITISFDFSCHTAVLFLSCLPCDLVTQYIYNTIMDLRSFQIRFESAIPIRFDSTVMGRIKNFRIGRVCQLLVVFRRLRPLTALSGTVYRLASSMSDHTPVLFNVFAFENWNEESVVRYISFISFVINY